MAGRNSKGVRSAEAFKESEVQVARKEPKHRGTERSESVEECACICAELRCQSGFAKPQGRPDLLMICSNDTVIFLIDVIFFLLLLFGGLNGITIDIFDLDHLGTKLHSFLFQKKSFW